MSDHEPMLLLCLGVQASSSHVTGPPFITQDKSTIESREGGSLEGHKASIQRTSRTEKCSAFFHHFMLPRLMPLHSMRHILNVITPRLSRPKRFVFWTFPWCLAKYVRAHANLEVIWVVVVTIGCILTALGHPLYNAVVLDVVRVVGLDISGNAIECTLERLLGSGVHHARL